MRALPLVDPVRAVPMGLVVNAREPGLAMTRALTGVARHTDVAGALERLPGVPGLP